MTETRVLTPTIGQTVRGSTFWVVAVVFVVLVGLGFFALAGTAADTARLSADNASPDGARALVEVLRQNGVEVTPTTSLVETEAAVGSADRTTLVIYDPEAWLDADTLREARSLVPDLVILDPGFAALSAIAPGVSSAGSPDPDDLSADCDTPDLEQARTVSSGGTSFRADESESLRVCLRSDGDGADDAYSLVELSDADGTVTILGATDAITNETILADDNAAFALALFGQTERLVWYLPSIADDLDVTDSASFTPPWLPPAIGLALATAAAAILWRARRFGPLIVENLPVVVRSTETMEGRARLYERGSARLRALDALRIGTIARLARTAGLGPAADTEAVVLAVAELVGRDVRSIRDLLVDDVPATDAQLVAASDRLLDLERSADAAARP